MEEQQTPQPAASPIYQESQEKNAKWLWLLIILIIIGALVFAFVRGIGPLSRFKLGGSQETEIESLSSPATFLTNPSPAATQEAELDRNQPKIRVLNGSGRAGAASAAKDYLEAKGYSVVSIGNAPSYDVAETLIRFKEGFSKFREILASDLSDKYSVKVSDDSLEATDSADIEVTIGSK